MATKVGDVGNVLRVKAAKIELVQMLDRTLDQEYKSLYQKYDIVGKSDEQATNYKTGELLWEDDEHTIPRYKDKWDYIDLSDSDLTPEQIAKRDAIQFLREALLNLV